MGSGIPKEAGDREKLRKILQRCITFYNRNRTEAGTCMEEGGKWELGTGGGSFGPPCPFPLITLLF